MEKGYTIPHSKNLESKIIGAMLVDSYGFLEAMPIIKLPEMFYVPKNQIIFRAIQELSDHNRKVDLLTVSEKLTEMGKLESIGGSYHLVQLTQEVDSSGHIEEWSRFLLQYWIKRKIIQKADLLRNKAFQDDSDSLDLLQEDANLNDEINAILHSGGRHKSYAENLAAVVKRVELLSNQKEGEFNGVPTGFKKVDGFTGGWQNSDLVIVAARPGMGKTALALRGFVECGVKGLSAGFMSLEMSAEQLTARTIAINSNFHLTQLIRDGFEKPEYFVTLKDREAEMRKFPLLIDDTVGMDIRDIISRARLWKRQHDIQILFVDYIQIITDKTKSNNREQEISSISRKLKQLAKELNIPVIALSQLSRKVEERGGSKRPKLSDIRESGAIEQDADIVTFLYRPEYYGIEIDHEEDEMEEFCNTEFIFAKYRAGSLGTIDLYFQGDKAKYSDYNEYEKYKSENNFEDAPFKIPNGDTDVAF